MLVDENIDKMIDAQGIKWLIEALQVACAATPSETSYRILVSGCRAVERICADEKKIYAIMQAQGMPTLLQIVSQHGPDEGCLGRRAAGSCEDDHAKGKRRVIPKVQDYECRRFCSKNAPAVDPRRAALRQHLRAHVAPPAAPPAPDRTGHSLQSARHAEAVPGRPDIVKTCLQALQNLSASPLRLSR
jgi:hypothetical protein